ncbi:MAG TPA: aldose epimerase family protein [Allosphingosinicella sp.]|jgi:aldose 1-epimerase|nr:aldose epimerase family protein [Allosphingosinicella sp.]
MRIAAALLPLALAAAPAWGATATTAPYGVLKDGRKVDQVTLTNDRGMVVKIINYGAIVTDMIVPDAQGRNANVALGFGSLADYEAKNGDYAFGAVMGRYAGRIARARFTLGGKEVRLVANDGPNALHGGPNGLFTKVWTMGTFHHGRIVGATLHYISPDGEQGFPGQLDVQVTYSLEPDNALRIEYAALTSKPTFLNLTNHSYFNLAGAGSGTVLHHRLQIVSDKLMESDQGGIPDGRFLPVADTPFDFREPKTIESMIDRPHPQMEGRRGFNHSWILPSDGRLHLAARLADLESGRQLEVLTTEPSLTVYTGNYFSGRDTGAQGVVYRPHDGIALEAQHLSDSPNRPEFPSTLLPRGEIFRSTTIYRFSTAGTR